MATTQLLHSHQTATTQALQPAISLARQLAYRLCAHNIKILTTE